MTHFAFWFSIAMAINVGVTFRSSDAYQRWTVGKQPLTTALLSVVRGGVTNPDDPNATEVRAWHKLVQQYLMVYLLAVFSDWLQGPYVYALYADYGYSQHDIALLFVAGFGSSMIFGSFVGSMADWGGRKLFVLLFAVLYACSCMTKRTYQY
jgi:hypothetical protein